MIDPPRDVARPIGIFADHTSIPVGPALKPGRDVVLDGKHHVKLTRQSGPD